MDMESSKYDTKVKGESKAMLKEMPIITSRKLKLIQQDSAFQGSGTGGTSGLVDKGLRDMLLEDYPTRGRKDKRLEALLCALGDHVSNIKEFISKSFPLELNAQAKLKTRLENETSKNRNRHQNATIQKINENQKWNYQKIETKIKNDDQQN